MKIKILILAGGKSERIWPLSNKALFPFLEKSLLQHQIERISGAGFKDMTVVCSKDNISVVEKLGVKNVLQKGHGQAAAILSAEKFVKGPVLVINVNDIFNPDLLKKVILAGQGKDVGICLVGFKTPFYFPGGYLVVNEKKEVKGLIEKPGEGKEPSDLVRIVVDLFKEGEELIKYLKKGILYEEAIDEMVQNKILTKAVSYQGHWGYLKYPWDTLQMTTCFLKEIKDKKIGQRVKIAKNVSISGPVIIEDGVKIFENAKIVGPAYIGKKTIIGNNSVVRQSMIGANCVVGFSTEITRSYVGNGCWFHSNYIGDSVLDENVSLGAGAILANLRLDEEDIYSVVKGEKVNTRRQKLGVMIGKNVRLGVNASIMPGIKIGKNSFVGAGVVLDKDLGENIFCCLGKQDLIIKENIKKTEKEKREKFRKKLV
ncbi:NTP transferase domain-containing protein [Candidatus Microgenomates bacterium]|nr:NTP transferase domain-containing protein [Candidatus Microgenomates bacterium]